MIGWWISRWGWLSVVTTLVTILLIAATSEVDLMLPNLVAGYTNTFRMGYALAFIPGLWWIVVRSNRPAAAEETSVRRMRIALLDLLLAFVPSAAALIFFGDQVIAGAARNMLIVVAVSLVASEFLSSQFAYLVPTAYLLAAGTAGFDYRATKPNGWALILDAWAPERDGPVLVIVVTIAFCVLIVSRLRGPGRSSRAH